MAQSIVTRAFEAWNVKKVLDGQPAVPDQIVFALIPNQDENQAVNRDEGMPAAAAIKHRAAITQSGVLNTNAVVYSAVLDTAVGDWDYNWIGLVDSKTNTVLMIVHVRTQQKIKTQNGRQGNSLTRNLAMQFDGAAAATQINVSAATWQIDFSARLYGMDESLRVAMLDYYGHAAFLDDGFNVSVSGTQATIAPGVGYVGGLRVALNAAASLSVSANTGVWVDVSRQGAVTGVWENRVTFIAADALADYTDATGYAHYVTKIATITNGQVASHRPLSPISELDDRFLPITGTARAANKLATARKIAGVAFDGANDIALSAENVGALAVAGTAVAANKLATARKIAGVEFDGSADITLLPANVGALAKEQNGTDIPDKTLFRQNVGLVKQVSVDDTSSGALMINGAHGIGSDARPRLNGATGGSVGCGFFSYSAFQEDNPFVYSGASGIHVQESATYGWDLLGRDGGGIALKLRQIENNSPRDWVDVWHSENLTPAAIGALSNSDIAGMPQLFPGGVAPVGWLKCNGQPFDTSQFPVLASRYPSGFLPDLRGEFVRGWDDGRGVDAGRALLSTQGDAIRNITGSGALTTGAQPGIFSGAFTHSAIDVTQITANTFPSQNGFAFDASRVVPTASENRPRNIAFNYIVRAA
ncbi:phage tail protein [Pectobacterium versatile]|uniref:phage tail-collar fiber domain-containing protein n=1 Tax=Pectobacterium versatile TaxID=2488639 RepID=UPI0030171708